VLQRHVYNILLDFSNNISRGVTITKISIIQFASASSYFLFLRAKYSPQNAVPNLPRPSGSWNVTDHVLHPYEIKAKLLRLIIYSSSTHNRPVPSSQDFPGFLARTSACSPLFLQCNAISCNFFCETVDFRCCRTNSSVFCVITRCKVV
jgi:hypothetical protein